MTERESLGLFLLAGVLTAMVAAFAFATESDPPVSLAMLAAFALGMLAMWLRPT